LTIEEDVKKLVSATVEKFGKIDILVNCAGIMRYGALDAVEQEDWDLQMKINTYAPWRLMKEVVPHMRSARGGSIVNISSIAGNKAYPNAGVYCTTKAALQMFSQVMAMELASEQIRVNMICPGMVEDTELVNPMIAREDILAFYAKIKPLHPLGRSGKPPLGRSGKPRDIANAVLFFASDESEWITGAVVPVDGGRHMATNRPEVKKSGE
jgi:NAD(P)-dependent dehydrogenase (short-subunit alcohol dehydrogenase family)